MKPFALALSLFCIALLVQSCEAYRLTGNLYFAMPNNTIKCIDVILPDDSGFLGRGEYEYLLTCSSNWSDLTEQIVRTDENNTARIPICFSGFGRREGDCSPPFTIGISSQALGIEEEWNGGVCISRYPDFDISDEAAEDEDDVRDILNTDADLFDIGFSLGRLFSEPGKAKVFSLLVESYASLTIDLSAETGLEVTPESETVQTSPSDPYRTVYLTVQAPGQMGEYELVVRAAIRNCEGSFCSKSARGVLVVNESAPETGFSVSLFPGSINVKELEPVLYTLTIQNHGKAKIFSTRIDIRPVTATDFEWRDDIIVMEDGTETTNFTVTPEDFSSLYGIEVTVSYEGLEKKASASLSTNEMLTDSIRDANYIGSLDPDLAGDAGSSLDDWYEGYRDSAYGTGLDSYRTLKDDFASLRNQTDGAGPEPHEPPAEEPDTGGEEQGIDLIWVALPVIIVIVAIILYMFFRKSEKTETEEEYF